MLSQERASDEGRSKKLKILVHVDCGHLRHEVLCAAYILTALHSIPHAMANISKARTTSYTMPQEVNCSRTRPLSLSLFITPPRECKIPKRHLSLVQNQARRGGGSIVESSTGRCACSPFLTPHHTPHRVGKGVERGEKRVFCISLDGKCWG